MIRIVKKKNVVNHQYLSILVVKALIEGKRRTISTSKIRKIIVTRKNRRENGKRVDEFESNPHSKGEAFSRLKLVLFEMRREIIIRAVTMNKMRLNNIIIKKIISSPKSPFGWKPNIQGILKRYFPHQ